MNSAARKALALTRDQAKKAACASLAAFGAGIGAGVLLHASTGSTQALGALAGAGTFVTMACQKTGAQRWLQGALGELRTKNAVGPLRAKGWWVRADVALPGTKANADLVLIPPCGSMAVNADTKAWHAAGALVRLKGKELWYGPWIQTEKVRTIQWESKKIQGVLKVPVVSVLVLDGARICRTTHPDGRIRVSPTFHVVEQSDLVAFLNSFHSRAPSSMPDRAAFLHTTKLAKLGLPKK